MVQIPNTNTPIEHYSQFNYRTPITNKYWWQIIRQRRRYPPTGQARTVPQKQWAAVITHLKVLLPCSRGILRYHLVIYKRRERCGTWEKLGIFLHCQRFCLCCGYKEKDNGTFWYESIICKTEWDQDWDENFHFLFRRDPLHSIVCILSWWVI